MAGLEHGEDFFSDDDLDALPQNALDELEQNAILQTQHQTQATLILGDPQSSDYGDGLEDDDLDDAVVINKAQAISDRRQSLNSRNAGPQTQREQFRQSRYGGYGNVNYLSNRVPLQQLNSLRHLPHIRVSEQIADEGVPLAQSVEVSRQAEADITVEALQKQVQELLHERENLQRDLSTKAGEIAIVRSKQEKAVKEYERELTAVRKINTERLAKQEKAIEIARDAEKSAATELEFLKRDLVEEAEKVRSLRKLKEKERETIGEPATPKKNKTLPYRDGFDDDEIQIISPVKFHARKSNPSTPTKIGTKRKRKGQDSPVVPLQVEENDRTQEGQEPNPGGISDLLLERIRKPDDRLSFLETILDHRPSRDNLRTIEEFARVAFPSTPQESFASIIFGKLPSLSKQSTADFPIEFCELLISLWKRCLTEKYYTPVSLLVDLLTFCIELKTLAVSPFLMETLLPVAQDTGTLIAWRRFHRQPYDEFEKYIDVSACLAIIHLIALGCMNDKDHSRNFWRWMRLEFVLVVLSQNQPVEDFDLMLQLLAMSVMKDSVGPIAIDPELQLKQAEYIIDRVSYMLTNSPTVPECSQKHNPSVISALRLQVLRTLYAFCQTPWGGEAIAVHQTAIGKLVKLMSDELDTLYDHRSRHKESARIVCLATRLLHHLTTKHEKNINMQNKLSRIHGGNQKYLICLARLNFSEDDLVLDAEIDPEVAECAHEMLELAVTPEEGDAIHSAFSNT